MSKLAWLSLALLALAAPGQALVLRYQFPPGQVLRYRTQATLRSQGTMLGEPMNISQRSTTNATLEVRPGATAARAALQVKEANAISHTLGSSTRTLRNACRRQLTLDGRGKLLASRTLQEGSRPLGQFDSLLQAIILPAGEVKPGDAWQYQVSDVAVTGKLVGLEQCGPYQCARLRYTATSGTYSPGAKEQSRQVLRLDWLFAYQQGLDYQVEGRVATTFTGGGLHPGESYGYQGECSFTRRLVE